MVRTFVAFCCRRIPIMMKATMKLQSSHLWSQSFMKFEPSSARQDNSFQSLAKQNIFKVDGSVVERYGTWHRLGNPSDAKRKGLEAETFRNDSETRGESSDLNHQLIQSDSSENTDPKRTGSWSFSTRFPDLPRLGSLDHLPKGHTQKGCPKKCGRTWERQECVMQKAPIQPREGEIRNRDPKRHRNPHFGSLEQSQPAISVAFTQFWLGVRRNCLSGGLRRWGGGVGNINVPWTCTHAAWWMLCKW